MRREWFQGKNPRHPHYDLVKSRRDKALANALSNIAMSGDADHWDEHGREDDGEVVHDDATPV